MVLIDKTKLDYALPLGSAMPAFSLKGTDGKTHAPRGLKPIVVIVFWCNHCPYVHAAEQRMIDIAARFSSVADFIAINSNDASDYPDDSFPRMQARAREKKYPFAYLVDETQEVARAFGAECTPHAFIFKDGKLAYQGRIDDAGTGKATRSELLDALIALTQGRPVATPLTPAMGCSVKWRQ